MKMQLVSVLFAGMIALPALCLAQQSPAGDLLQGIKADHFAYKLGEPVRLTYAVRNRGSKPITLSFSSAKQHDIWITRGDTEVFRFSKGRMYATMLTTLVLQPGQTKSFDFTWNQKDNNGQDIGPGTYTVHAQLTPTRNQPPPVRTSIQIGSTGAAQVPVTVREAIQRSTELLGRDVVIAAIYRGRQPDPSDPNCKDGPPVTKSDWVIADHTGCMYVTGAANLDPVKDLGVRITVTGKVRRTDKGQVYLTLDRALMEKPV